MCGRRTEPEAHQGAPLTYASPITERWSPHLGEVETAALHARREPPRRGPLAISLPLEQGFPRVIPITSPGFDPRFPGHFPWNLRGGILENGKPLPAVFLNRDTAHIAAASVVTTIRPSPGVRNADVTFPAPEVARGRKPRGTKMIGDDEPVKAQARSGASALFSGEARARGAAPMTSTGNRGRGPGSADVHPPARRSSTPRADRRRSPRDPPRGLSPESRPGAQSGKGKTASIINPSTKSPPARRLSRNAQATYHSGHSG